MDKYKTSCGIVLTIIIYFISVIFGELVKIQSEFIPRSFISHLTMFLLTGFAIYYYQYKGILKTEIKRITIKKFFRIIPITIIAFILTSVLSTIFIKILNLQGRMNFNPFLDYSPCQYIIYFLLLASIVEELLFRGFLLNMLDTAKVRWIQIFRIKISYSVMISGLLFGLAHLCLLKSDAGNLFVFRVIFLTTIIGITAGYFQEKYENNTLAAIIVHMTSNSLGMLGLLCFSAMNK
ncbi:MAG: lysostaphin resistance A-like protein [Clostridiales bacterium]